MDFTNKPPLGITKIENHGQFNFKQQPDGKPGTLMQENLKKIQKLSTLN